MVNCPGLSFAAKELSLSFPEIPPALALDPTVESQVTARLLEHFGPSYGARVQDYVAALMAVDHYSGRFLHLRQVVGPQVFKSDSRILVSGCGAGGEMIAARQWGFGEVHGVEVDPIWVSVCEERLAQLGDMHPRYYDGDHLPYPDGTFDVVASGHVIEHTRDPRLYLAESLRVLKPAGYLSLEYPTRYHHRELHTQLPSLEWLPRPVRDAAYRLLASRLSPLGSVAKQRYGSIYSTRLQQISFPSIRWWLNRNGLAYKILNLTRPAPGVIRLVIQRQQLG